MIGGDRSIPSFLSRQYDVPEACLKIDLQYYSVVQKASMRYGRYQFGLCSIGHMIYVIGGSGRNDMGIDDCERYNTFTDKWTKLNVLPDEFYRGINVGVI